MHTVYCKTPAIEDRYNSSQLFVGKDIPLTDVYGVKSDNQFASMFPDNIRQWGSMDKIISDRAQVEISNKVKEMLCALFIGDWKSEPHKYFQNPT